MAKSSISKFLKDTDIEFEEEGELLEEGSLETLLGKGEFSSTEERAMMEFINGGAND
jgi:hypothetical protein